MYVHFLFTLSVSFHYFERDKINAYKEVDETENRQAHAKCHFQPIGQFIILLLLS